MTQKRTQTAPKTARVIVVNGGEGHYRAKRFWPNGKTEAEVTADDLKTLKADPRLAVHEASEGATLEGMALDDLYQHAKTAVEALDARLGEGKSAALTLKGWKPTAQEGQEAPGKDAGGEKPQNAAPKGPGAGGELPEALPYRAAFAAAGKTWADVLEMVAREQMVAGAVPDIGATRAGEVVDWMEANVDKATGAVKTK